MYSSKFFGSVMIVVGTTVGAGMLALPIVGAASGFWLSSLLMVGMCLISTLTGFFVIEANLALPNHACSFSSMAEQILGKLGKVVTWIAYLFLLYIITYAYTSGESSIMTKLLKSSLHLEIEHWVTSLVFISVLGTAVFSSTKTVDFFNRGLISVKGFLLIATLILTLPHIDIIKLTSTDVMSFSRAKYMWAAAPVFLASFCAQFVIPSIRLYIGPDIRQLKWIVIYGTSIPLLLYILWLASSFGIIPITGAENSFTSIAEKSSSVGEFTHTLTVLVNNKWVASCINGFTNIAMTTSFLGVSLSLFDFLADGFKRPNTKFGRLQTTLMTFIPPLIFSIFFPEGFVMAINYAVIAVAILLFILPALMVYNLRRNPNLKSPYRTKCNNFGIWLVVLFGAVMIVLPILIKLGLVPQL